jgi:dCMP deaminase
MKDKFISAYMDVAERFSQLSYAERAKVGAIIVKDDRIISIGYNGMPSGWDNRCEDTFTWPDGHPEFRTRPEVLHAEANAIAKLAQSNENAKGATLFCTHLPCMECAKLIYQSGINIVYYRVEYEAAKGTGKKFLIESGVQVTHYA